MKRKKSYTRIEKLKIAGRVALLLVTFFGPMVWSVSCYGEIVPGLLLGVMGVLILFVISIITMHLWMFRHYPQFRESTLRRWRNEAAARRIRRSRWINDLIGGVGSYGDLLGED